MQVTDGKTIDAEDSIGYSEEEVLYMWIVTRLKIGNEHAFFSVGPMELLQNIEKYASINQATKAMGMSYTKAIRIIRIMEKELGFAVVVSEKGGSTHGNTKLTEKGKQVLTAFEEIYEEVSCHAQRLLEDKFSF